MASNEENNGIMLYTFKRKTKVSSDNVQTLEWREM